MKKVLIISGVVAVAALIAVMHAHGGKKEKRYNSGTFGIQDAENAEMPANLNLIKCRKRALVAA